MHLFESIIRGLKGSVGQNLDNNPDDIQKTERELKSQGYFKNDYSEGFITRALDEGLRAFQREKTLKTDGIMHPGGETEQTLFGRVEKRTSPYKNTPSTISLSKQEPPTPQEKPVPPEPFRESFSFDDAPVINVEKDRIQSILQNTPAKFEI